MSFDDEESTSPGVARRHPASEENNGVPESQQEAIHHLWGGQAELREALRVVNDRLKTMQMEMRTMHSEMKKESRDSEDHRLSARHTRALVSICGVLVVVGQLIQTYIKVSGK